jgi:hypothetical protein
MAAAAVALTAMGFLAAIGKQNLAMVRRTCAYHRGLASCIGCAYR